MSNLVMILGKSGAGKSSSIRTLDPKSTVVVNVLNKRLPFKGSQSLYSKENRNFTMMNEAGQIVQFLQGVDKAMPEVRNIVIDDATYIMREEQFKLAKVTGYGKFVDMAAHFQAVIKEATSMRDNINVFLVMHSEEIFSDNTVIGYKAATVGKMIDSSYNPIEVVPMLLYADIKYDSDKNAQYGFWTRKVLVGQAEIPAKTPYGMFEEEFIPNDLKYVVEKMDEYYK